MSRTIQTRSFQEGELVVFEGQLHDRWVSADGRESDELHWWEMRFDTHLPDLTIARAWATPRHLPYAECPLAAAAVGRLVGAVLTKGFRARAAEALVSTQGCTHLHTLALSLGSTQVISRYLSLREGILDHVPPTPEHAARIQDACRGWRGDGSLVQSARSQTPRPGPWHEGDAVIDEKPYVDGP